MQTRHIGRMQRGGPAWDTPLAESGYAFGTFAAHALRKALRRVVEPGTEAMVKAPADGYTLLQVALLVQAAVLAARLPEALATLKLTALYAM